MCIVIDMNTLPSVLNSSVSDHREFQPIVDWLGATKAQIVYGGTSYKKELRKMPRYYGYLLEMRRAGKVHEADEAKVDRLQQAIAQTNAGHRNFNDQAIVAIVIVSRCRLVCSNDKKSFPFLTSPTLYPRGIQRPKIYSGSRNVKLLYHRHIVGQCGPCSIC